MTRAALSVLAALLLAVPDASGAGRRPYGGAVTLPVANFQGLDDPHIVVSRSERLMAALGHCRLLRRDGAGQLVPELVTDLGAVNGRTVKWTLVEGARFHDGSAITAQDVQQSFARLAALGERAPLSALFKTLTVQARGPRELVVTGATGLEAAELRALVARPGAAVLAAGRPGPGRGCGPFKRVAGNGTMRQLDAFSGHPEGRPWLDRVTARIVEAEGNAFVFGDVDLAFADGPRQRRVGRAMPSGHVSYVAMVHPRLRGVEGTAFRKAVAGLAKQARLGRYVDGRAVSAVRPWPDALSPTRATTGRPSGVPQLGALVVAYPEGDDELADLARALRDVLRPLTAGSARAVGVAGLDVVRARAGVDASWDLALLRHEWAAQTPAQAAWEVASVFGVGGMPAWKVLARRLKAWAKPVAQDAGLVALLHVERPVLVRPGLTVGAVGGLPQLGDAWRER